MYRSDPGPCRSTAARSDTLKLTRRAHRAAKASVTATLSVRPIKQRFVRQSLLRAGQNLRLVKTIFLSLFFSEFAVSVTLGPEAELGSLGDRNAIAWYDALMLRITVMICFTLTLFCPVVCLADTDGDCSAHAEQNGDNCEAMSIGAVVAKPTCGILSPDQYRLSLEGLLSPATADVNSFNRFLWDARHQAAAKPPPAARRQALLQSFLF